MCVLANAGALAQRSNVAEDRAQLLKDVQVVRVPGGIPGDLVVFGKDAFTLICGRSGKANLPVFAAAHAGSGRVVAGGHEGFFGETALKNPDNATLAANIVRWLTPLGADKPSIWLIGQSDALKSVLSEHGNSVLVTSANNISSVLNGRGVLWLDQASLDNNLDAADRVSDWVSKGNGVVITGPAWGWKEVHPGRDLVHQQTGNRIAIPLGLAFASDMLDAYRGGGFAGGDQVIRLTAANDALDALERANKGGETLNSAELGQVTTILGASMDVLSGSNESYAKRVAALCKDKGSQIPTRDAPITTAQPFARLKAILDFHAAQHEPGGSVMAYPSAADFPGAVPNDTARKTVKIEVDTSVPAWHALGLYVPAGEIVTIEASAQATVSSLHFRVGPHTDTLWHLDRWQRFPEVSTYFRLKGEVTKIASPFGGTLFLDVPGRCKAGKLIFTVIGAVPAPRFVRGQTTNEEWIRSIRSSPGPWAELEGNLVCISVPSSAIRDLDDPEALMAYWDEVMEHCYSFFAAPRRDRPERYCVDRQISAGYMHSGYPIMTGDDVAKTFCDVKTLRGSVGITCWGFYHEMGHNFQQPEWTWEPFGEVTNNLFSLYGTETLNRAMVGAHPAMTQAEITKRIHNVATKPGVETYFSKDPWYPLTMFWLMRQEFGWEPFTKLFAEFRDLPRGQRPKSEREKHDQFLQRFSRISGKNLTEYLKAWGIDFSVGADRGVINLPRWMPKDWQ